MEASTSRESKNESVQVTLKSADGKLITTVPGFIKFSHTVADLMELQVNVQQNDPIDLLGIHSEVIEQINIIVQKLEKEELLKGMMPKGSYDDKLWNEFTIANLRQFNEWASNISSDMLIHISNAAQFLQMKAIVHFSIAVLAERAKGKSQNELRQFLNESNEMDEEMRLQLEKARKTHPDL